MPTVSAAARRYPFVVATLIVAVVGGVLLATPIAWLTPWIVSAFAVLMATRAFWSMVQELRQGNLGLDVLAVTAIGAAVAVGEYWAALVVVLMLTSGEALEDYAANRAKRDLSSLISNAPRTAHRLAEDGTTSETPIDDVRPGDRLLVRAHEVVPVDGTLASDAGVFDESSLTGESLPIERSFGDEVLSGGVNGATAVAVVATRPAKDSQYQQIVTLVEEAAASKPPMVRLADRFAVPFTLVAWIIAGFAWWVTGDPVRFAEVLVVATPCPLIIAAPVAFMAGMSRSARSGAIVKSSATLELFHRAQSIAFDKTGTLTKGAPELVAVHPHGGFDREQVLRLAAAAESASAHVLAGAVVAGATSEGLTPPPVSNATESTANGITATVEGHVVVVGKRSFVASSIAEDVPAAPLTAGELAVSVAIDGAYAGSLLLRDAIRSNSKQTIESLRQQGVRHILMLTGDDRPTAEFVAAELGIDEVKANCLPRDKVEAVQSVDHRPVIMVGDGVNDAPVLAVADVGIAMGARGSTAASESADVVILQDDISRVASAVKVGRETVTVALQSVWIGILFSVALMIVAALGFLPAIAGAWMQEAVDVVSILWALRAVGSLREKPSGQAVSSDAWSSLTPQSSK